MSELFPIWNMIQSYWLEHDNSLDVSLSCSIDPNSLALPVHVRCALKAEVNSEHL
jgi:hypothetical protein